MRSFLTGAPILKPKERSKRCAFSYSMCTCIDIVIFSTTQLFIKLKLLVHVCTMREGSAKKNNFGKSRNGRTNINVEGQRSNAGDEGDTSKRFGVPYCTIWSVDLYNEKT